MGSPWPGLEEGKLAEGKLFFDNLGQDEKILDWIYFTCAETNFVISNIDT